MREVNLEETDLNEINLEEISMKIMPLQKLLFCPDERLDRNLFYRVKRPDSSGIIKNGVLITKGNVWKANTYFNSFSMKKWMKYTGTKNIFLVLELKGVCEISVYETHVCCDSVYSRKISSRLCTNETDMEKLCIAVPAQECFQSVYFEIAAREQTYFYGGFYGTDTVFSREVGLAVVMCTYHRTEYVRRTVGRLQKRIFQNSESGLKNKLHIFLVDNSGSDDMKKYETQNIHVFSQKEKGSSGGFARGLLEVQKRKAHTHCIFMDDDVFLYAEVLERLYRFLGCLKKQYDTLTIGGGLLRADLPFLQHEAGAVWNAGMIKSCKSGYDLRNYEQTVRNETEEPVSYMGWWMCCVPLAAVEKNGYPLPLYFHRDDIEFGLRNTAQTTLNGICAWHEPFEAKTGIVNEYYDMRNTGIVNALHQVPYGKRIYMMCLARKVTVSLFRYKYRAAELILKGAEDFLKHPDQIVSMDCGGFYRRLKKYSYPEYTADVYGVQSASIQDTGKHIPFWIKYFTFNGAVFPAKGKKTVDAFEPDTDLFWRLKEAYFYNSYTDTVYKTIRSNRKAVKYMLRLACMLVRTACFYSKVSQEWRMKFSELVSEEHWQKILD